MPYWSATASSLVFGESAARLPAGLPYRTIFLLPTATEDGLGVPVAASLQKPVHVQHWVAGSISAQCRIPTQSIYFCAIGGPCQMRGSSLFSPGAACSRLYSFRSTRRCTQRTVFSSNPWVTMSRALKFPRHKAGGSHPGSRKAEEYSDRFDLASTTRWEACRCRKQQMTELV
jgi:hypothetical protein